MNEMNSRLARRRTSWKTPAHRINLLLMRILVRGCGDEERPQTKKKELDKTLKVNLLVEKEQQNEIRPSLFWSQSFRGGSLGG